VFLDVVGDVVALDDGEVGVDSDVSFGAEAVPDPAHPEVGNGFDAVDAADGGGGLLDGGGVDQRSPRSAPD
jgi:hypothetical protein